MKVLKDDIYKSILNEARKEFMKKGFKDTSMRKIAKNANVGLSNIYNYFRNKDEIYSAIVKPAKEAIFTFITEGNSEKNYEFCNMSESGHFDADVMAYIEMIEKYKEEYRLLFYHSHGSSFSNFRNELTDHMSKVSFNYMGVEKQHNAEAKEISPFFIHIMASWAVSILGEVVIHKLEKQKIRDFFWEYLRFQHAGWKELIGT